MDWTKLSLYPCVYVYLFHPTVSWSTSICMDTSIRDDLNTKKDIIDDMILFRESIWSFGKRSFTISCFHLEVIEMNFINLVVGGRNFLIFLDRYLRPIAPPKFHVYLPYLCMRGEVVMIICNCDECVVILRIQHKVTIYIHANNQTRSRSGLARRVQATKQYAH
jgi:hypothetical protein